MTSKLLIAQVVDRGQVFSFCGRLVPVKTATEVGVRAIQDHKVIECVTTLIDTTPTTRLASLPRANHMASDTVD